MRTKFQPCGSKLNSEYWEVDQESGEILRHTGHSPNNKGPEEEFWYCTGRYGSVDLCRNCMIKYGLLW